MQKQNSGALLGNNGNTNQAKKPQAKQGQKSGPKKQAPGRGNNQLATKLGSLKNSQTARKQANALPSPNTFGVDGVDHINIWGRRPTSELGKALNIDNAQHPFNHTVFGRFNTIQGFWYYIRSNMACDGFRTLAGKALGNCARQYQMSRAINFRPMLIDAMYQRIIQNQALVDLVKKNAHLPIDAYSEDDMGLRIRPDFHSWLIGGMKEVFKAVVEGREPKLDYLRDDDLAGKFDMYHAYLPESFRERRRQAQEMKERQAEHAAAKNNALDADAAERARIDKEIEAAYQQREKVAAKHQGNINLMPALADFDDAKVVSVEQVDGLNVVHAELPPGMLHSRDIDYDNCKVVNVARGPDGLVVEFEEVADVSAGQIEAEHGDSQLTDASTSQLTGNFPQNRHPEDDEVIHERNEDEGKIDMSEVSPCSTVNLQLADANPVEVM